MGVPKPYEPTSLRRTMMGRGGLLSSNFPEGINGEGEFWKVVIEEKETRYGVTTGRKKSDQLIKLVFMGLKENAPRQNSIKATSYALDLMLWYCCIQKLVKQPCFHIFRLKCCCIYRLN